MDAASEGSNLMEKAGSEQEDIRHTIAQAVSVIKKMLIFQIVVIDICLEDVILRAAQMEQIVEKVCEERLNTGVSKISDYFYEQFQFFKGWKLTNTVCFTSRS
ncbi:unnamed protein product [Brassica oleracea var. botrytis]|uniref:(rape) hypothetical protein n=1 Tax=Brassica napus TaxID=3708 RepID=A0A816MJD5_BRANA|nr:unnamed protein product [Brassica napus]